MIALTILGIFLIVVIVYLTVIIFFPILKVESQTMELLDGKAEKEPPPCRENVEFTVGGSTVSGWLYLPRERLKPAPCIVMSHGFSGTKDMGLENYALKFIEAGYAALAYDYRYYGESDGQPRQLYCGPDQLNDLRAAVDYVRSREEIDPSQIVLWGTSAGGNYGALIAAEDNRIAAVIAQCASFDHKEDSRLYMEREGFGFFLKLFVHGQRDKGRSRFGLSAHTYPAYGKPGTIAMITGPGAFEGIENLARGSKHFRNETCARLALLPHNPDPLKTANGVHCPVLFLVCQKDELVSPSSHVKMAQALGSKAVVREYPIGHFEIYSGKPFETAMKDQLKFLDEVLD